MRTRRLAVLIPIAAMALFSVAGSAQARENQPGDDHGGRGRGEVARQAQPGDDRGRELVEPGDDRGVDLIDARDDRGQDPVRHGEPEPGDDRGADVA